MSGVLASLIGSYSVAGNAYDSIATSIVGSGGASTITFSSIPSTYTHLQLRVWGYNTSGSPRSLEFKFNSDAGTNYSNHYVYGDGTSAFAGGVASRNYCYVYDASSAQRGFNGDSTKASCFIIDILDYKNTSKNKTVRSLGGWDGAGSGNIGLASSQWMSTAAINRIDFTLPYSTNYGQYTKIALYGIKGA